MKQEILINARETVHITSIATKVAKFLSCQMHNKSHLEAVLQAVDILSGPGENKFFFPHYTKIGSGDNLQQKPCLQTLRQEQLMHIMTEVPRIS